MLCCKLPNVYVHKTPNSPRCSVTTSLTTYITHSARNPYENIGAHTNGESLLDLKMKEIAKTFNLKNPVLRAAHEFTAPYPDCAVVHIANVQDTPSIQLLYWLCASYKTVHLYNSVLNVASLERFAIVAGFVAPAGLPASCQPHMYFMTKLEDLNVMFGQQQLDLMNSYDLCADWCSRYY